MTGKLVEPTLKTKNSNEAAWMRIDPALPLKLQRLGASKLPRCYNCGTCTAICPLSQKGAEFPRTLVKYAVLGAEDKLLSSPLPWLCYYCGDCAENCPRDADPGSFMMAARRYAIIKYSLGRLASTFYESPVSFTIGLAIPTIVVLLGVFLLGGPAVSPVSLSSFLSFELLDKAGILLMAFLAFNFLVGFAAMRRMHATVGSDVKIPLTKRLYVWLSTLATVIRELLTQFNLLKCGGKPRYVAHVAIFWGFMGLMTASAMNLITFGVKGSPLYPIPPQRVLGVISGAVLVCGASYFIYKRFRKDEEYVKFSHFTDWALLIILLLSAISGFLLTLSLYLNLTSAAYILFTLHLAISADLLILIPFTKLAHSFYRPFAIWMNEASMKMKELKKHVGFPATGG